MTQEIKLKAGMQLICIKDDREARQGDLLEVIVPETECCGGFTARNAKTGEEYDSHFQKADFEIYKEGHKVCEHIRVNSSGVLESASDTVDKDAVLKEFNRILVSLALSARGGWVDADIVRNQICQSMVTMNIYEDFKKNGGV